MMWDGKEGKTGAKGQNRMTAEQVKGSRKKETWRMKEKVKRKKHNNGRRRRIKDKRQKIRRKESGMQKDQTKSDG